MRGGLFNGTLQALKRPSPYVLKASASTSFFSRTPKSPNMLKDGKTQFQKNVGSDDTCIDPKWGVLVRTSEGPFLYQVGIKSCSRGVGRPSLNLQMPFQDPQKGIVAKLHLMGAPCKGAPHLRESQHGLTSQDLREGFSLEIDQITRDVHENRKESNLRTSSICFWGSWTKS